MKEREKTDKLTFSGGFVLVVLLLLGLGGRVLCVYVEDQWPAIVCDVLRVIADACITAGVIDILLSFSSQKQLTNSVKQQIQESTEDIKHSVAEQEQYANSVRQQIEASAEDIKSSIAKQKYDGIFSLVLMNYKKQEKRTLSITEVEKALSNISESLSIGLYYFENNPVYYDYYHRQVFLERMQEDIIGVTTTTEIKIVNLSEKEYKFVHDPQFYSNSGIGETYEVQAVTVDGRGFSAPELKEIVDKEFVHSYPNAPYVNGKALEVYVEPFASKEITFKTFYKTPLSMFYQAKVLTLPCHKFRLSAHFDTNFAHNDEVFVFRWTVFRADPEEQENRNLKGKNVEENENISLQISEIEGLSSGNGYSLAVGKMKKSSSE